MLVERGEANEQSEDTRTRRADKIKIPSDKFSNSLNYQEDIETSCEYSTKRFR